MVNEMQSDDMQAKLAHNILLVPTLKQTKYIDRDLLLECRLYNFIMFKIKDHIEELKQRCPQYRNISNCISELMTRDFEIDKKLRAAEGVSELTDDDVRTLIAEKADVKMKIKELGKKKFQFFKENRQSILKVRMDSRRCHVVLDSDMQTALYSPDAPTKDADIAVNTETSLNGMKYYSFGNLKKLYTIVDGSIHPYENGLYKATLQSVGSITIKASVDESGKALTDDNGVYVPLDKVYEGIPVTQCNDNRMTVLWPDEWVRIDELKNKNKAFAFVLKFASERVYSIKKNPNTNETQKTAKTYRDFGIVTYEMYGIALRLKMSFADFPLERKHSFCKIDEFNDLYSDKTKHTLLRLVKNEDDGKFYLRLRTSLEAYTDIPVCPSVRNKSRIGTEYDYDTAWLEKAYSMEAVKIDLIRETIRGNKRYYIKIVMDASECPERYFTENSYRNTLGLGTGNIGIDPCCRYFTVVGDNGKKCRIVNWETMSPKINENISKLRERAHEISEAMGRSVYGCNPDAIDRETGSYKKGCGKRLVYSPHYMNLKKEYQEINRRISAIKNAAMIHIAHVIRSWGDCCILEIPLREIDRRRKSGVLVKENGMCASNQTHGRSSQKFAISTMLDTVLEKFVLAGGKVVYVENRDINDISASMYSPDGHHRHREVNERIINVFDGKNMFMVQRDIHSAFVLQNTELYEQVFEKNGRPKQFHGYNVYRVVKRDEQSIKDNEKSLAVANEAEMNRLMNMVRNGCNIDDTIGYNTYFKSIDKK